MEADAEMILVLGAGQMTEDSVHEYAVVVGVVRLLEVQVCPPRRGKHILLLAHWWRTGLECL